MRGYATLTIITVLHLLARKALKSSLKISSLYPAARYSAILIKLHVILECLKTPWESESARVQLLRQGNDFLPSASVHHTSYSLWGFTTGFNFFLCRSRLAWRDVTELIESDQLKIDAAREMENFPTTSSWKSQRWLSLPRLTKSRLRALMSFLNGRNHSIDFGSESARASLLPLADRALDNA